MFSLFISNYQAYVLLRTSLAGMGCLKLWLWIWPPVYALLEQSRNVSHFNMSFWQSPSLCMRFLVRLTCLTEINTSNVPWAPLSISILHLLAWKLQTNPSYNRTFLRIRHLRVWPKNVGALHGYFNVVFFKRLHSLDAFIVAKHQWSQNTSQTYRLCTVIKSAALWSTLLSPLTIILPQSFDIATLNRVTGIFHRSSLSATSDRKSSAPV